MPPVASAETRKKAPGAPLPPSGIPPWKRLAPIAVAVLIALLPAPPGLDQHAWYFAAIFAGVITGLIFEPLPGGAVGLIGITIIAVFSRWFLFGPEQLARPDFRPDNAALAWALSGFSNTIVWLIFGAFMFALGYERTGLGRRIALLLVRKMGRNTLTLGYAVALADLILAPFTPSNTARSGGTIYPVIRNLPEIYDSKPNDPSARRIGSYILWVGIASTCVTSSMFPTALASNVLAIELVRQTIGIELAWTQWFLAFLPVGVLLLAVVPLLAYRLYPPELKESPEVGRWARQELARMGPPSRREATLAVLACGALSLWIFGTGFIHPTGVALLVVCLMLILRVITWEDMLSYKGAWNTLVWFATLVALADGLNRTGFVHWFTEGAAQPMMGISPAVATVALLLIFFFTHYMFASTTAHATALLPVMLAVGSTIPGMDLPGLALVLCLSLGIMGIISPYATGPSPIYYGSGYLPAKDYWRLGGIFGLIYLAALLFIGLPWMHFVLG